MNCFIIYQMMFLILDELNDENKNENLITYLTDANPFMRSGETSVDEIIYDDFLKSIIHIIIKRIMLMNLFVIN